jgi:hypothetical protein
MVHAQRSKGSQSESRQTIEVLYQRSTVAFLEYFFADLNQHLRLIESARAMSFRKDRPLLNDCFTVMGIFREMPRYRETLEEIVKSCHLTRRQNRPPDANIGQVNLYLSSGKSGNP